MDLCRRRTRGGGLFEWKNEESTDVALGFLFLVCCFCRCLSCGGRGDVEPGLLFMRLQEQAFIQGQFEESSVKAVKLGGGLAEGDNGWSQLGFAFRFLVFRIDTAQIGVPEFPCEVQMGPQMVENLFEPALACELLGWSLLRPHGRCGFVGPGPSDD